VDRFEEPSRGVALLGSAAIVLGLVGLAISLPVALGGLLSLCAEASATSGTGGEAARAIHLIWFGTGTIAGLAAFLAVIAGFGLVWLQGWARLLGLGAALLAVIAAGLQMLLTTRPVGDPHAELQPFFMFFGRLSAVACTLIAFALLAATLGYYLPSVALPAVGRRAQAPLLRRRSHAA